MIAIRPDARKGRVSPGRHPIGCRRGRRRAGRHRRGRRGARAMGCSVTLLERYPYLGGLASGGMVLVLDDMCNGQEITVTRHLHRNDRAHGEARRLRRIRRPRIAGPSWRCGANGRAGALFDFTCSKPQPIVYAAAFDPDGFKRVSNEMIAEAKRRPAPAFAGSAAPSSRTAPSRASSARPRTAARRSWARSSSTRPAISTSRPRPARRSSTAPTSSPPCSVSAASTPRRPSASSYEEPEAFKAIDREAKRIDRRLVGRLVAQDAAPGRRLVQLPAHDRLRRAEGRRPDPRRFRGPQAHRLRWSTSCAPTCRASRNCYVVDVAPQLGVRQTRLLEGDYVVTKDDVTNRVHFADSVARGRDYYTPYRSHAAARRRGPPRRRAALLGDVIGAEHVARDPALHGDGRSRPAWRRRWR